MNNERVFNLRRITHYDVLGLEKSASQKDIRQAYKQNVLKYHPVMNSDE
jgi:DnaJ-class molecular chaperone